MQWVTVENGRHWRLDSSSNQHLGWQLVNLKYFSPFSFCLIRSKVTLKGWAFYYWYIAFMENFIEIELNFHQGLPCPYRNYSFKDGVFEKKMHLFEVTLMHISICQSQFIMSSSMWDTGLTPIYSRILERKKVQAFCL